MEVHHGHSLLDSDGTDRCVIAKLVMPGPDPRIFLTILLGIGGAFVGGYVGSFLGLGSVTGLNPGSLLLSVGGAVLILILHRTIRKR